ncbi:ccr4 associated factor [Coemansia aciculifera]|uniref:Ccr4 associated factor n=1 Tax=Coemansia aciculifera TaxID=417176 RepID=A0ACC1M113_9FUNG|nr:ccr4 associated factor [Coemansia aciculifera]
MHIITAGRGARAALTTLGRRRCFMTTRSATELSRELDTQASYATLEGRSVISVSGADAQTFLQGMQCNDMARALGSGGMFTGFLAPQGRMVADAFLYAAPEGFLIEVDQRVSARVLKTLQFYRLRANVTIRDASAEHAIWSVWGGKGDPAAPLNVARTGAAAGTVDSRAPHMGLRLVMGSHLQPSLPAHYSQQSSSDVQLRRILRGVAEGADDFVSGVAVPLECNLDYMGGVHFSKGCYVGQELTIRTHHRGVVRKRLFPVLLGPMELPLSADVGATCMLARPGADIVCVRADDAPRPRRAAAPGRLGSVVGNVGLAMLRIDDVTAYEAGANVSFEAVTTNKECVQARPWTPAWWPQEKGQSSATATTPDA